MSRTIALELRTVVSAWYCAGVSGFEGGAGASSSVKSGGGGSLGMEPAIVSVSGVGRRKTMSGRPLSRVGECFCLRHFEGALRVSFHAIL